jgi:hypothetical protein
MGINQRTEAMFILDNIPQHQPGYFIKTGMASDMSSGLIARLMYENGEGKLVTLDHGNNFFSHKSKENGYRIEEILEGQAAEVPKKPFTVGPDIGDAANIDLAVHRTSWPLLNHRPDDPATTQTQMIDTCKP